MSNKDQQDRYSVEDMVEAAHTKASLDRNPDKKRETREVVVQEDGSEQRKMKRNSI